MFDEKEHGERYTKETEEEEQGGRISELELPHEIANCIVGIVRTWRTPFRPSRAVTVEYPFVFRPSRE